MLLLASQRLLHTEPGMNMPALLLLQWRWQGQQTRHMSEQSRNISVNNPAPKAASFMYLRIG